MVVDVKTDAKVASLRAQLPAVLETGYFNTGSYGPLPEVALEAASAVMQAELRHGRIVPGGYDANRDRNRRVAHLAAGLFGADADEIALTHSASEGLNIGLMGLTWDPGDEIVTTTEEHPGLLLPLALLARQHGVITRFADVGNGGTDIVEQIARSITSRTRVIALSHVLWSTGAVLPLRRIADLAAEHELLVIVDAAQAAGHVPINLHEFGVDVYAMAGQKWLCGPEATGFLYIRRDRFADIAPTYARYGDFDLGGFYMPAPGARRYEIGEFNGPTIAAQEAVLRWLRDDVGLEWALRRIADVGQSFLQQIRGARGISLVTPATACAGLVNFTIDGLHPNDVTAVLFERGFTVRAVDAEPCVVSVRASIGWWNTEEEVAGLAAAVRDIAGGGHGECV